MKIKETLLSACAVVAVLAGTAACTSSGGGATAGAEPKAAPTADAVCEGGVYSWFNVDKRDVLTGVAEKEKVERKGAALTHALTRLHTPRVAVTFEKGSRAIEAKAVLQALAVRIGVAEADDDGVSTAFADVHRPAQNLGGGTTTIDGVGTVVRYAWVEQVTADFRYACGAGKPVTGRATSWVVDGSGLLECSTPIEGAKEGEPALTAARLSCDPGAPAATA
ncbi:hypothetical protein ACIPQA_17150 [Streptomyces sp. NPDC090109]|uniref:hypothetical protein n=1 Tax=Streptomyces sp. NPDC090109 TaxID=3365948 RepID=UPI003820F21A